MNRSKLYYVFSIFLLALVSISLVYTTVHSHQHFEWKHTTSHVDTGNCLTENDNLCPICAKLLDAEIGTVTLSTDLIPVSEFINILPTFQPTDPFTGLLTGRSPPASV